MKNTENNWIDLNDFSFELIYALSVIYIYNDKIQYTTKAFLFISYVLGQDNIQKQIRMAEIPPDVH